MLLHSLLAVAALAATDPVTHNGRVRQLDVRLPRHEAAVEIDGRLDEPEWSRAAVLTGFTTYLPVDGRAAEDSTEVLVWSSPTALHIGIRAYEPHGAVRATHADRDRLDAEDHVQIVLDTFGDARQAYVLAVNALGVQADGIRTENRVNYEAKPGLGNVDLSPNFVFDSKGRVTEWGYEVEVRVPFKSLRYSRGRESWRLNVIRQVQHSGHQTTWAPVRQADASFLAASGTLRGLHGIRRGLSLDVNPVFTSTTAGARTNDAWGYGTEPRIGANVRWGITPDLTLNATYNPDFSQVEADAGQIPGDTRYAIAFPERRPFFVEGADLFDVPSRLVYTRRIVEPVAAAKMTGKVGETEVGFLSAVESSGQSAGGDANPLFHVLRLRRGIGGGSTLGALFTDRSEPGGFNRVGSVDARLLFGGSTRVALQAAGSATRQDGETTNAPLWVASASHNTRRWGVFQYLGGVHPDFRAESGLLDRTDMVQSQSFARLSHFGEAGGALESWSGRLIVNGLWLYDGFFDGRAPLETKVWLENGVKLRGGWNLVLTRMFEGFAFDARDYAHYRVERSGGAGAADTVPFHVSPRQHTGGWYFVGNTPQYRHFSVSAAAFTGIDPYFAETLAARRLDLQAAVQWAPSERLRVDASYAHSEFVRRDDGSRAAVLDIPRLKLEYQLARPLFLRLVGQYHAQAADALREPVTGAPILLPRAGGEFARSERVVRNDLRLDGLLSYQPTPGTVVFVGYGSSMTEPDRLALRELRRTRDALFIKLSYVFRS
jgi:hypothetical protein